MPEPKPIPYRREAFTHVVNLGLLAAVAAAGFYDPRLWALAVPIELAVLWIVPDLPPFRLLVERKHNEQSLLLERTSYLEQLWGLQPSQRQRGWRSWVFETP